MTVGRAFRRGRAVMAMVAASLVALVACGSSTDQSASDDSNGGDRGGEVYAESCASCHGSDLRGTDKGPSFLSIVYEPNHHSDESFRRAIAVGAPQHHWPFGDMEPVEGLSVEDVDAVIDYVRSQQQLLGFEQG